MTIHSIKSIQKIPAPLQDVWGLFSSAGNLQTITPANMNFRVISKEQADRLFEGQIIEYKVSPLFGIPLYWKTEIISVNEKISFIDEQRKGPYSLWHHEHHFKEIPGGVEMTDLVKYKIPFGILGEIANSILVRKKLRKIFEYRYNKVEELLGKWEGQAMSINIQ